MTTNTKTKKTKTKTMRQVTIAVRLTRDEAEQAAAAANRDALPLAIWARQAVLRAAAEWRCEVVKP